MEFYEFDATLYAQFVDDSGGMKFSVIVRFVMDLLYGNDFNVSKVPRFEWRLKGESYTLLCVYV